MVDGLVVEVDGCDPTFGLIYIFFSLESVVACEVITQLLWFSSVRIYFDSKLTDGVTLHLGLGSG